MKRAFATAAVAEMILVLLLLRSAVKDFLWTHPWWHSFFVALPAIALPILAYFELLHSGEANVLRAEANGLRAGAIELQGRVADLTSKLDKERNANLQQIAKNTQRPVTQAERNAGILRKYLRANVSVSEGQGGWGNTPEIVDVGEDNVVTLFTPQSHTTPRAWCVKVQCDQLEIAEIPQGACPIRVKILKRYGPDVNLGEITRWEDRLKPQTAPTFSKSGGAAFYARYVKPGSSESRNLYVFPHSDGSNAFQLEASTGEKFTGDNVEISKRFMVVQVEYEAAGFSRSNASGGGGTYKLFIKT